MRRLVSLSALVPLALACGDATAPLRSSKSSPAVISVFAPTAQVFIANADGTNPTFLTAGSDPSWSPDGERIAFSRAGVLYFMDASGANAIALRQGWRPRWSPEGKRLAFTDSSGIVVMDLETMAVTTVIRHHFNPDTYKLWDMGVDQPTWSPDGQRIAFQHNGDGDMEPATIYVMNSDGSQVERLSRHPTRRWSESDPSWSPDGSRIAHFSVGSGITLTNVGDRAPNRLNAVGAEPSWSPDGRNILFNSWGYANPQLFIVPASGGQIRTLVANAHSADWSPDGSKIVFVRELSRKQKH